MLVPSVWCFLRCFVRDDRNDHLLFWDQVKGGFISYTTRWEPFWLDRYVFLWVHTLLVRLRTNLKLIWELLNSACTNCWLVVRLSHLCWVVFFSKVQGDSTILWISILFTCDLLVRSVLKKLLLSCCVLNSTFWRFLLFKIRHIFLDH